MGIGTATGDKRAEKSAFDAINSPLLEVSINGAKGILLSIAGGDDLTLHEVAEAAKIVTESADKDAKVIFGTCKDDRLKKGEMKVTVIATGFPTAIGNAPQKKSLFEKPVTATTVSLPEEKKEIHNTLQDASLEKRMATAEIIDDEALGGDDMDDWSAVPAFLRRKK
jgi:cell division protein FtsZ